MTEAVVRPPFPKLIDNTINSMISSCLQKVKLGHIDNWAPMGVSIHLHAGGAFAAGMEAAKRAFYETGKDEAHSLRDGLEAMIKFYGPITPPSARSGDKSLDNLIKAYDSYYQRYPLGKDPIRPIVAANGKAMVEFAFTMPTQIKHPETGDPILYGGRADVIGKMREELWVTDEKTASSLGETWASQWDLDSQFTGYIAAARLHGYPVAGALVRGVGLLKTKITHAECLVLRSTWEIERWWQQLHRNIQRLIRAWEEGYYDYAITKGTCGAYGGCEFAMLCKSPQPEGYLPIYFRQRKWDPLAKDHGEKVLENKEAMQQLEAPDLHIPGL